MKESVFDEDMVKSMLFLCIWLAVYCTSVWQWPYCLCMLSILTSKSVVISASKAFMSCWLCYYLWASFKKFCNFDCKKYRNGSNANYRLFFYLVTTKVNAFGHISAKLFMLLKLLCPFFHPGFHRSLERFVVWIANTTKMRIQILKQIIVTAGQVITLCRII